MNNDITFCCAKLCPRDCYRKKHPTSLVHVSMADFESELKPKIQAGSTHRVGDMKIDYEKCDYFIEVSK